MGYVFLYSICSCQAIQLQEAKYLDLAGRLIQSTYNYLVNMYYCYYYITLLPKILIR